MLKDFESGQKNLVNFSFWKNERYKTTNYEFLIQIS